MENKVLVKWRGPRDYCNACNGAIHDQPFYDAATQMGWGLLCEDCFKEYGCKLGVGRGQAYNAQGIKVGG